MTMKQNNLPYFGMVYPKNTDLELNVALRKLAHATCRDFLTFKIENFQLKIFDIFLIFAQNIDCRPFILRDVRSKH